MSLVTFKDGTDSISLEVVVDLFDLDFMTICITTVKETVSSISTPSIISTLTMTLSLSGIFIVAVSVVVVVVFVVAS